MKLGEKGLFSRLFRRKDTQEKAADLAAEAAFVLINTSGESAAHILEERSEDEEPLPEYLAKVSDIEAVCRNLTLCRNKQQLLAVIGREVSTYPLTLPEQMYASFAAKVNNLPASYRDALLPAIHSQIFDAYHDLLRLYRAGEDAVHDEPCREDLSRYCAMVVAACRAKAAQKDPTALWMKYLLACYSMYVAEEPAHPVGTPFPGGQIVDTWDGVYYCPVRNQADDVPFALCSFCPAVQSDEPIYPWSYKIRQKRERQASLQNYWTNYKG